MDEKQIKLDGQNGGTDIPYVNSAEVVGLINIRNSAAILRQLVDFARQWKVASNNSKEILKRKNVLIVSIGKKKLLQHGRSDAPLLF